MRSDNLELPCVQPLTSSYNFQFPHGHHGHVCHGGHGGCGEHGGHGSRGEHGGHGHGHGTGRAKLPFKLYFRATW